jgi:hypothetical protein
LARVSEKKSEHGFCVGGLVGERGTVGLGLTMRFGFGLGTGVAELVGHAVKGRLGLGLGNNEKKTKSRHKKQAHT